MRKIGIRTFLAICFFACVSSLAMADDQGASWKCEITGELSGYRIGVIVGIQGFKGSGTITCEHSSTAELVEVPVDFDMGGIGLGIGFAKINGIKIKSVGIGVENPEILYDSFSVGPSAGIALINNGLTFDGAIKLSNESGVGFELGLTHEELIGVDVHLHARTFSIERAM